MKTRGDRVGNRSSSKAGPDFGFMRDEKGKNSRARFLKKRWFAQNSIVFVYLLQEGGVERGSPD